MRKAVKLAAVSTMAAMAMVGASATAATAHGAPGPVGSNTCGNELGSGWAQASWGGQAEVEDIEDNVTFDNVICQNGEENYAVIINENHYEGLSLAQALDLLGGLLD